MASGAVRRLPSLGADLERTAGLAIVLGLSLAAAPALAAGGHAFAGKTSDGHRLTFRASRTQVNAFSFQTVFSCPRTGTFVARATYNRIKVTKGKFSASFATPTRSIRTTISGSIRGRRASGTIHRTATFNSQRKLDPHGTLSCTSQTTWSAKRRH